MAEETWRTPHMLELSIPARGPAGSTEGRAQTERVLHAPARDGADDLRELGATLDSALPAAEAPALDVALLEKRELEVAMKDRELELLRKEAELLRKERELKALRLKLGAGGEGQGRAARPRERRRSRSPRGSSSSRSSSRGRRRDGRSKRARSFSRSRSRSRGRRRSRSPQGHGRRQPSRDGGHARGNSFLPAGARPWSGGPPMPMMCNVAASSMAHAPRAPPAAMQHGMPRAPAPRAEAGVILKRVVQIPNSRVGTVIGKQGTTIAQIERMAGVSASVEKAPVRADGEAGAAGELVRLIHLEAHDPAKLSMAEQLIGQLLADQIDGRLLARGIIQPVSKPGSRRV